MLIRQLSIFLENREGRLEKLTDILAKNGINIVTISLADTSEFGMVRMIVSDPDKAKAVLKEAGFSAMLTDVIAIKISNQVGVMHNLLSVFAKEQISVEYMYTIATGAKASIVMKTNDAVKARDLLLANGYELFMADRKSVV